MGGRAATVGVAGSWTGTGARGSGRARECETGDVRRVDRETTKAHGYPEVGSRDSLLRNASHDGDGGRIHGWD